MTITNLIPTGNHSYSSGAVAYIGGSTDYTNLSDASDTTYFTLTNNNAYASFPLTDQLEILSVTAATVHIRCANGSSKGDFAKLESVQVFKSDGSTAITPIALQTSTITATTYDITFSSITIDDIASWNGAVLKVKQDGGSEIGIRVYELSIDITYTTNPDRVGSGGVKLGYTSPVRRSDTYNSGSGNWTVPYDVYSVEIEVWGGGGGGGAGDAAGAGVGGDGAGGGGYCRKYNLAVTPAGTVSYVVGGGGAGNTNGSFDCLIGSTGGNSSANGGAYVANGGVGGQSCGSSAPGAGGTASGGDINSTGTTGTARSGNNGGAGGAGAGSVSSPGGSGGTGGTSNTSSGGPGTAPGGGGGGGGRGFFGANGASGRVRFSYDTVVLFTPGPNRMSSLIGSNAISSIINNSMVVPINLSTI